MKIRALAAAMAAASMLIVPIAAQAGTSAASMSVPVSYGVHSAATVTKKNNAIGTSFFLIALGAGAAAAGLYFAFKKDKDRTPGAQS